MKTEPYKSIRKQLECRYRVSGGMLDAPGFMSLHSKCTNPKIVEQYSYHMKFSVIESIFVCIDCDWRKP